MEYDKIRDNYLQSIGITLIRYSNQEIDDNLEKVLENIRSHLNEF